MSQPFQVFGGFGTALGRVRRLAPTTFTQFVHEFLSLPVTLGLSREQFWALEEPHRRKAKIVNFVCPASFDPSGIRDHSHAVDFCHLLFLDIDDHAIAFKIVDALDAFHEMMAPYAYALHVTASSTPEKPRLRLVVFAEACPLKEYATTVQALANKLRIPTNRESLIPVQPMFLPTLFRGDDPSFHPLLRSRLDGEGFSVLPGMDTSGPSEEAPSKGTFDIANFQPGVEEATLEHVAGALQHLDPDCGYYEWLGIAAALKHQFGDDANALALFDEWSAKGKKYVDSAETKAKWDSLSANPNRTPITIRSLFHRAKLAGWSPVSGKQAAFDQWLALEGLDPAKIQSEGLPKLAALTGLSKLETAVYVKKFAKTLGTTTSIVSRELKRLRLVRKPDMSMPLWARGFCYVTGEDAFYHLPTGISMSAPALDRNFGKQLLDGSSRPEIMPQDYLLNVLQIPRAHATAYDPRTERSTIFERDGVKYANTYVPTYPTAVHGGEAEAAGAMLKKHLGILIKEEEYQSLLLDFFAYLVQAPGQKVRWAPLIQGGEGCGKSVLGEAMAAVLGRKHVKSVSPDALFSQFTDWSYNAQLVVLEEVRIVGHNRHEVMNRLKPLLTNDRIAVNEKHIALQHVDNVTNYMGLTNYPDAMSLTPNDRRYFVLASPLQNKREIMAVHATGHFDRLFDMIQHDAAALRGFFEDYKISSAFNPSDRPPHTPYAEDMMDLSRPPITAAILELIENGANLLIQKDLLSPQAILSELERRDLPPFTLQTVKGCLRELGYYQLGVAGTRPTFSFWTTSDSRYHLSHDVAKIAFEGNYRIQMSL